MVLLHSLHRQRHGNKVDLLGRVAPELGRALGRPPLNDLAPIKLSRPLGFNKYWKPTLLGGGERLC